MKRCSGIMMKMLMSFQLEVLENSDIYYNVAVLKPVGFEKAIEDEKWWITM